MKTFFMLAPKSISGLIVVLIIWPIFEIFAFAGIQLSFLNGARLEGLPFYLHSFALTFPIIYFIAGYIYGLVSRRKEQKTE